MTRTAMVGAAMPREVLPARASAATAIFVSFVLVSGLGCGGDAEQDEGCTDCPQGCCLRGACIPLAQLTDVACGSSGGACVSCAAQGMTCNTASGQCVSSMDDPLIAPQSCDPSCDPLTHACIGGICQEVITRPDPCNPPCDTLSQLCVGGVCQPINPTSCAGCTAPNVCHQGQCLDKAQVCRQTCAGCCLADGTCLPLGAGGGQNADRCGKDGAQCMSCQSAQVSCDVDRGICGSAAGNLVRICIHSANVNGSYEDDDCGFGVAPEVFVRFEVGGEVIGTTPYGSVAMGGDGGPQVWNVGWGGQCVDVDTTNAYKNGIDILALDQDSGPFCGGDDYIGKCKTNPSAWSLTFGHKFALDGARCEGKLEELWIEVLPQ